MHVYSIASSAAVENIPEIQEWRNREPSADSVVPVHRKKDDTSACAPSWGCFISALTAVLYALRFEEEFMRYEVGYVE